MEGIRGAGKREDSSDAMEYRPIGLILILIGTVLVLNIFYLDTITIFPNGGAGFIPILYAVLTTIGFLLLLSGISLVTDIRVIVSGYRSVFFVAIGAVVSFSIFDQVTGFVFDFPVVRESLYSIRVIFVSGISSSIFAFVGSMRLRARKPIVLSIGLFGFFLVLGFLDWRFSPLLGPILDGYHFLTGAPILGIPYLGSSILVTIIIMGYWYAGINDPNIS